MNIGLKDLHPSVGDVLAARVWNMRSQITRPEDAGVRSVIGRRWKGLGWRILAAVPIGATVGAGIVALAGGPPEAMVGVGFMGAYLSGIAIGVGSVLAGRMGRRHSVSAEEMRALSAGMDFPRPQTVYLDTVCALMEAGDNVSESTGRDILETLNELLEQAIYVGSRLDRLQKAASTESLDDLSRERNSLAERAARAGDFAARVDLEQSLKICDERMANARALAPLIERMDAQREVIQQTMLSVQASVSRLQVAPSAVAAPDVDEVRRVLTDVTAQTRAVEDAVQQVIALRS